MPVQQILSENMSVSDMTRNMFDNCHVTHVPKMARDHATAVMSLAHSLQLNDIYCC